MAVTTDDDDMSSSKRSSNKSNQQSKGNLPTQIFNAIPPGFKHIEFDKLEASKCYEKRTLVCLIDKTYPIIKRKNGFLRKLLVTDAHEYGNAEAKKLTVFLFDKFAEASESAEAEGFILIVNFITENLTSKCPQNSIMPIQVLVMNPDSHVWFARKECASSESEGPSPQPKKKVANKAPVVAKSKDELVPESKAEVINGDNSSAKSKKKVTSKPTTPTKPKEQSQENKVVNVPDDKPKSKKKTTSKTTSIPKSADLLNDENLTDDQINIDVDNSFKKIQNTNKASTSAKSRVKVIPMKDKDENEEIQIISMESPMKQKKKGATTPTKVPLERTVPAEKELSPKKSPYIYHQLNELSETGTDKNFHIFGVLSKCNLKVMQGNGNRILELTLTDETDTEFTCSVFGGKEDTFPDAHPGDIVRLHRIQVTKFRGKLKGKCFDPRFIMVFSNEDNDKIKTRTVANTWTFTAEDHMRVKQLFQYAEKKSEPKLICEIRKGDSANIICQVISVYIAKTTDCVVMKIWDGTKTTEFESQHKGLPGEKMDQTLYTVAKDYYVNLFVFGSYCLSAGELNPGDYIEIQDAHLNVSKQEPYEATLRIQGGQKEGRGIQLLDEEDERVTILKKRLEKIIEDVRQYGALNQSLGVNESFFQNLSSFSSQNPKEVPKDAVSTTPKSSPSKETLTSLTPQKSATVHPPTQAPEEVTKVNSWPNNKTFSKPKDAEDMTNSVQANLNKIQANSGKETSLQSKDSTSLQSKDATSSQLNDATSSQSVRNIMLVSQLIGAKDTEALKSAQKNSQVNQTETKDTTSQKTQKTSYEPQPGTSKDSTSVPIPQSTRGNFTNEPQPGTSKGSTNVPLPSNVRSSVFNQPETSQPGRPEPSESTQVDFVLPSEIQEPLNTPSTQERQIISVLSAGIKHGQSTQGFGEGLTRSGLQGPSSSTAPDPVNNPTFLEDRMQLMENPTQYPTQFNFQNLNSSFPSATPDEWWKTVPAVSETIGHSNIKPSSLSAVVRHDVPFKFRIFSVVLNYKPDTTTIQSLIRLYCPSCKFLSEDADTSFQSFKIVDDFPYYHCPECLKNKDMQVDLEYTFLLSFSLHDGTDTSSIEACLWRQHAVNFFKGITPEETLRDSSAADTVFEMLWTVCPNCRPIDVAGPTDNADFRSYPTLDCCILSYTAGGSTRYQIFDTKLI